MIRLWEILVPASNKKKPFSYDHHKVWDEYVRSIAGGLTVFKTAKGQWVAPDGKIFKDRMIPVRVACSEEQLFEILTFTKEHYNQKAVFSYLISERVIVWPLNIES